MSKIGYLKSVLQHPVNARNPAAAVVRIARWYFGSRLVPGPVAVPFIEGTRLLVNASLGGATENIYTGLSEFEDMSFALHLVHDGDLFVDVGANVGAYSILMAGVRKCKTIAIEPSPTTCIRLRENVALNGLGDLIEICNLGIGDAPGRLSLTASLDTVNHVVFDANCIDLTDVVEVATLDALLGTRCATLMKIDVEGFETQVLRGAQRVLSDPQFLAAIVETNESGRRYGFSDADINSAMADHGFGRFTYNPSRRELAPLAAHTRSPTRNTIYLRDRAAVDARLQAALRFRVGPLDL